MIKITSFSVKDTLAIGMALARQVNKGDIICLVGELGSGKTVLTKGIAIGLGAKKEEVISPTFVLIREYEAKFPIYHFDLYRLNEVDDIIRLGYEEYFYDQGVSIVEWADKLKQLMPLEYLKVDIQIRKDGARVFKFKPVGRHYKEILEKIDENIRH
ncbi:MAG: tRNA (adenosine(37)-N6)-threonylcarbamoyltransferase complex ATPase subunit type 1 TsaE [Candidatus Omnitrophota bacterium]|nr:tRNA (adenosine(37)-N6)-threonylcarbamoyltransferase complex ATPase subunit type 1 TsaE [Candidatus Omnitrophota bacterium]MBU1928589.1 tRNA (adenosine(37)-N6)-threonylcarbamoyltransferase complex ATPase subunit type 1 TsaE [Candidatus Omnitrophota bacterium]MBU2034602.1 tRNA (adenosine(37)-N6)-threonylcarbamoyltransferase complex ATPase subunit type 1 TsaE [Candidatus Omnitrophota bacterium]MBU2221973.1 tRNA (adenosine(37)-N6)-threonylcarbamoyltransferase complex ATPase subunit type 1 TsaE [